ncbi:MAG: hypothetical protein Q4B48_01585 [Syntrophomonadaceae bacterium]|nr:hypothetical protein [Syntrophomonadaceae bacterium]
MFKLLKAQEHELDLMNYREAARQERNRRRGKWLALAALLLLPALLLGGYRAALQRQMAAWEAELTVMQTESALYAALPEERLAAEQAEQRRQALAELTQTAAALSPLLDWSAALDIEGLSINEAVLTATDFTLIGHAQNYAALPDLAAQMAAAPWLTEAQAAECRWDDSRQLYAFTLRAETEVPAL